MITRLALGVLCLFFLATPAPAESPAPVAKEARDVTTYTAKDYAFTGPDEIAAGWITTKLVNAGDDLHQMQFLKLPEGRSVQDFAAEITANYTRLPHWVHRQGGPNSVVPGEYAAATVNLEPGNYVLICGIPDRRGVPHVALGMLKALRVTPGLPKTPEPPQADVTITGEDFTFQVSKPIRAGKKTVRVVNKGSQAHEVVVVQLARRATVNAFLDDFQPGVVTSPLGKPVGGMVGLEPGGEGFFTMDFKPGRYGLICFLPDLTRGAPHFTRGMLMDINID
jgi:uncharacterized cupredoxin-like copper-binding protein